MVAVSVVVPVYGVERYIERCARSLFGQTLQDMEFIFVNDCTKDNSMEILQRVISDYPNRTTQIKIINHPTNKGLPSARRTGVEASTGLYIAHCDSDDWVDTDMYEKMYDFALNNRHDFVKCAYQKNNNYDYYEENHPIKCNELSKENVIILLLNLKGWNSIWDTLVHRNVYEKTPIYYAKYPMFEDMVMAVQLISNAKSVGLIDIPFYHYYVNQNSICNMLDVDSIKKNSWGAKNNVDWILSHIRNNFDINEDNYLPLKLTVKYLTIPIIKEKDFKKIWHELYPETKRQILLTGKISLRNKVKFILIEYNLYKFLR